MNKFLSVQQWLNEKKKEEEPLYGCVMMEPRKIEGWEELHLAGIDEDDIYDTINGEYGKETQPHITILYGIHEDEVDPSVIVDMMEQKMKPVKVEISEIDIFENEKYDVVKYNVPVTKQLLKYRDMFLTSFENTQTFKDYHPHMTIAYVKPGTGKKYKKKLNNPFEVEFIRGVYSYHKIVKGDEEPELIRRVVNVEPEPQENTDSGVINSKPFKTK